MKINFMLLHTKHTLVQEGSGYSRTGIPMDVYISVLAHFVMKHMTQFIVRLNLILNMMPYCYAVAVAVDGLINCSWFKESIGIPECVYK